jgi:tellurite resistance protein
MHNKNFYTQLGNLLYAVASADGKIRKKEINSIKQIITNELVPAEDSLDPYGTDMAFYSEFQFDLNLERSTNTKAAFNSFIEYFKNHPEIFNDPVKLMVMNMAISVAVSFNGCNKSELNILTDLKQVFGLDIKLKIN